MLVALRAWRGAALRAAHRPQAARWRCRRRAWAWRPRCHSWVSPLAGERLALWDEDLEARVAHWHDALLIASRARRRWPSAAGRGFPEADALRSREARHAGGMAILSEPGNWVAPGQGRGQLRGAVGGTGARGAGRGATLVRCAPRRLRQGPAPA
jgi:hypothetical protein